MRAKHYGGNGMKLFRKGLRLFLALMIAAVLLPDPALPAAASEVTESGALGENLTWTLDGAGVLTVSGAGDMPEDFRGFCDPDIKKVVIHAGVTSIAAEAFAECTALTSVEIPESVAEIGDYAFYGCTALRSAALPSGLTRIGESAFSGCTALSSVKIPGSVESVGAYAFSDCAGLGKVTIDEGVRGIASGVFQNCDALVSVKLPDSVTSVSYDAFFDCAGLKKLLVGEGNPVYASADGILYDKEMKTLLCCPAGKAGKLTVPEGVTRIGESAFRGCAELTSVKLPQSVTEIGGYAFENCSALSVVTLPGGITEIGSGAFSGCSVLRSAEIPGSVKAVAPHTFSGCYGLRVVTLSKGITSIGAEAFSYCAGLNSIEIPGSVTRIEADAFLSAGLEAIIFAGDAPKGVSGAFASADALAYYPKGNTSWTKKARETLSKNASLTWETYAPGEKPTLTPLEITKQPKTTYTAFGKKAKVTVKAAGDGLTYQWYYKNAGSSKYKESSIKSATYALKMTEARHNKKLYCVVTDRYGNSVKTDTVSMRMAATVTTQPKTAYTKVGERAKFKVTAVGEGLTYQWYYQPEGSANYKKASSTKATYYPEMTEARKDRKLYCVVTDKYGNSVRTNTIRMRLAASITSEPKSVKAELGTKAKTTVKAVGDGLTYQWYYKDVGSSKYKKSSNTKATYTAEMKPERDGRKIYCVVTDKYSNTAQTKTVTIKKK